jgi:acetyl-CoA synthetase
MEIADLTAAGLGQEPAAELAAALAKALDPRDLARSWRRISKQLLKPEHPFAAHRAVHRWAMRGWDGARGPAPAWVPSADEIAASNLARVMGDDYGAFHRRSIAAPEAHWGDTIARLGVVARRAPDRVLDASAGAEAARWLPGMRLNIAETALAGDRDRVAVIVGREGGGLERHDLGELRDDTLRVVAALRALGIASGDAVAVDMPMTYASVAIYLGIVAAGAACVGIADSFSAPEIAARVRIGQAKAIFTQDAVVRGAKRIPLYERVVAAGAPRAVVIGAESKLRDGDLSWDAFLAAGRGDDELFVADVDAVTNVLFSSGTTGDPKAIPWTHATPIKAAADGYYHHDIRRGDVVAWPTSLGWMMGPWLIYASLVNGAAMALYDGSPLERGFGELVRDAGVTMLGVVPSLVKTWRASACMEGLDWSTIRCFSSTGEASNHDDMLWLMARAGYKPVIEYCGGTEIGGGYITGTVVQPQAPAAFSTPALGCSFVLIDEDGRPSESGELALVAPMFGSSSRLSNADHHAVYFEGMPSGPNGEVLRRHGDHMAHLGGGYHRAHGRVDDTMNLGGIKVSSVEIERVCNKVEGVHETAAIAAEPEGGGPSLLVLYAVARAGAALEVASLKTGFQAAIRRDLNPLYKVHDVVLVDALPRTASNKVMRRVLRTRYAAR